MSEKTNAKQFPKVYYCKHIQAGVVKYLNEMVFIDNDALKRMTPSFVGKPVYIKHAEVNLDTLKEDASGYVSDSFYNELDGWFWLKFIAVDDEANEKIGQGRESTRKYLKDNSKIMHKIKKLVVEKLKAKPKV